MNRYLNFMNRYLNFRNTCLLAMILVLVVVFLGAYVRLSDAGIGCPDWPGCYGKIVPSADYVQQALMPPASIQGFDLAKAWKEMVHRYAAALLGICVLWMLLRNLAERRLYPGCLPLTVILSLLIVFQAALGMWTVIALLQPFIVVLHLLGGFVIMSLIWWINMTVRHVPPQPKVATAIDTAKITCAGCIAGGILLFLQISLGGFVSANYAALSCQGFPLCNNQWWPLSADWLAPFRQLLAAPADLNYEFGFLDVNNRISIHFLHRIGALMVLIYWLVFTSCLLRSTASRTTKTASSVILALLFAQITLGGMNVLLSLPMTTAIAHHMLAALLLLGVLFLFKSSLKCI